MASELTATTQQGGTYVGNPSRPGVIDFALGQPSPRLLPIDVVGKAAGELADADRLLLQYGATRGHGPFLEALASFLGRRHGVEVPTDHLMASGAISLSLSLLSDVFGREAGVVVCEDPTYFLARGIFDSAGLRSVGIPVDTEGLRVDLLARRIEAGLRPGFIYLIPTHQNPTGSCLSPARRDALFELARRWDFVVVADEPYNLLDFGAGPAPLPLAATPGAAGCVVSVGSFTKILGPGLRTGWVHASPDLLERFAGHGVFRSGGALNPVVSWVIARIIEAGALDRIVDGLVTTLRRRCEVMCSALTKHIPDLDFVAPEGGYFVWGRFPAGVDTNALRRIAVEEGTSFCPGSRCTIEADATNALRLSFAFYEPEEIEEGVRRLALAYGRIGASID